jgi:Arc/MetJ-type ribon-helix-helix transcriptional regulator
MTAAYYTENMRSLTVRLPDQLVREIEAESRARDCAKSDVVRERLQRGAEPASSASARLNLIADLIGSVDGLSADMSGRRKRYLKATGYGKKHTR